MRVLDPCVSSITIRIRRPSQTALKISLSLTAAELVELEDRTWRSSESRR